MAAMPTAAMPTLPFPPAPLASAAAQAYVANNWAYKGGVTSFVSFVADPYPGANPGTVFQVAFTPGFNFMHGGKLPGVYGGTGGCSGGPTYPGEQLYKRDYGVDLGVGSWNFTTTG
ncbi:hypothetical protein RQP46_007957 [Phenoliferia psychrophenolica]